MAPGAEACEHGKLIGVAGGSVWEAAGSQQPPAVRAAAAAEGLLRQEGTSRPWRGALHMASADRWARRAGCAVCRGRDCGLALQHGPARAVNSVHQGAAEHPSARSHIQVHLHAHSNIAGIMTDPAWLACVVDIKTHSIPCTGLPAASPSPDPAAPPAGL